MVAAVVQVQSSGGAASRGTVRTAAACDRCKLRFTPSPSCQPRVRFRQPLWSRTLPRKPAADPAAGPQKPAHRPTCTGPHLSAGVWIPGQGIRVPVLCAFAMNNLEIELPEQELPARQLTLGVLHLEQPLQRRVVSPEYETTSDEVRTEMLRSPDCRQQLTLRHIVLSLRLSQCTTRIRNHVITLHQRSTNPGPTHICVLQERRSCKIEHGNARTGAETSATFRVSNATCSSSPQLKTPVSLRQLGKRLCQQGVPTDMTPEITAQAKKHPHLLGGCGCRPLFDQVGFLRVTLYACGTHLKPQEFQRSSDTVSAYPGRGRVQIVSVRRAHARGWRVSRPGYGS